MEKDYCYDPYNSNKKKTQAIAIKNANQSSGCCCCCVSESRRSKCKSFWTGLITNLGICILLFGYTLIGSVIFLAIEGGQETTTTTTNILATTSSLATKRSLNASDLNERLQKVRAKTVENIWDITVSLNILYRDNWTRLAAQEITRFQDEIIRTVSAGGGVEVGVQAVHQSNAQETRIYQQHFEWTFARSFLYSLTILTTIGYGSVAPKTSLGKAVTMGYAIFGIPLTLLYLSSVGSILSRIARGFFSRALCCCLCSNCGYCCYDEKRMAEKERRMRKKRQQMEQQHQQQMGGGLQEPFYVRSGSAFSTTTSSTATSLQGGVANCLTRSPSRDSAADDASVHGLAILAPVALCLCAMFAYICLGTFILFELEQCDLLDGFYFCFMSLTTIGFGDMLIVGNEATGSGGTNDGRLFLAQRYDSSTTLWFCSVYIMSGMALTAMCFNVVHDEIVHRLRHESKAFRKALAAGSYPDDLNSCTYGGSTGPDLPYAPS